MKSQAKTVKDYLASLPNDRRAAIEAVREVILETWTKVTRKASIRNDRVLPGSMRSLSFSLAGNGLVHYLDRTRTYFSHSDAPKAGSTSNWL